MPVQYHFQSVITLTQRNELKLFIEKMVRREGRKLAGLQLIFCDDEYLLQINRDFLQHDYYTDIITFDLSNPGDDAITAEIYISTDRVKENASTYACTIRRELHRVIFHGVLHLCGYGDKSTSQQAAMRKKEDEYLRKYFN